VWKKKKEYFRGRFHKTESQNQEKKSSRNVGTQSLDSPKKKT